MTVALPEQTTTGSQLAIQEDQTFFTDLQVATLRQIGMDRASNGDLGVFFHQVQRTGLDPFAKQIYMINRQGKETIQTGIDGFRLIARRATDRSGGTFGYEDTLWMDNNGQWLEVWPHDYPPVAAKTVVLRNGGRFPAIAMFHEYAGKKRDGKLNQMWSTKGALMVAKCSEALALRKAFPQDLSGLYTSDEMQQADNPAQMQATRQQPTQAAPQGNVNGQGQPPQQGNARTQNAVNEVAEALGGTVTSQTTAPTNTAQNQALTLDNDGYPAPVDTNDPDEDQRIDGIVTLIRSKETHAELQAINDEFIGSVKGIHYDAFIAALNARLAQINQAMATA